METILLFSENTFEENFLDFLYISFGDSLIPYYEKILIFLYF